MLQAMCDLLQLFCIRILEPARIKFDHWTLLQRRRQRRESRGERCSQRDLLVFEFLSGRPWKTSRLRTSRETSWVRQTLFKLTAETWARCRTILVSYFTRWLTVILLDFIHEFLNTYPCAKSNYSFVTGRRYLKSVTGK